MSDQAVSELGKNIKARMKALGITQSELAERANLTQVMIHKLTSGKSTKSTRIVDLARALHCTPEELLYGMGPSGTSVTEPLRAYEANAELQKATLVPLISWVMAGAWCESPDNYATGDAEEWMPAPYKHGNRAFCLKVIGDSMSPEYREDEIILVDPDVEARHNDDVVVRTTNGQHTFKRLQITPDGMYLLALNPAEPNRKILIPPETHVCGVVIGSWMRRR